VCIVQTGFANGSNGWVCVHWYQSQRTRSGEKNLTNTYSHQRFLKFWRELIFTMKDKIFSRLLACHFENPSVLAFKMGGKYSERGDFWCTRFEQIFPLGISRLISLRE